MIGQDEIHNTMICSVDILSRSGISRATLNNYIKKGLLPHPIITKPVKNASIKAKRIGYFPDSTLDTLKIIRQYKNEGYSMDRICNLLMMKENEPSGANSNAREINNRESQYRIDGSSDSAVYEALKDIRLTINDLHCPAYLINKNFEIDWINTLAEENLFGRNVRSINIAKSRNIFGIFIAMGLLQPQISDHKIIDLHMSLYKRNHLKESLNKLTPVMTTIDIGLLMDIYDSSDKISEDIHSECLTMKRPNDGMKITYRMYNIIFSEGILCLYVPIITKMQESVGFLPRRGKVIHDLTEQSMPTFFYFSVLVADFQDSIRICAELPPEEYFVLMNQIWKCTEGSFKKYYGTYGNHSGDKIVYYFLKDYDSNYLMNAILCALDLRQKMEILSNEWKVSKGWFKDLYLNVGINEGQEFFRTISAAPCIEFTPFGNSVNYAGRLSEFARFGAIWTTKDFMNRLAELDRKKILYGVHSREQNRDILIENVFSRVMDLVALESPKYSKFIDIGTLPVTEIHNLR